MGVGPIEKIALPPPPKSNVDPLTKMCFGCGFARGFQFIEQQVVQQIHNKQQIEVNEFDV